MVFDVRLSHHEGGIHIAFPNSERSASYDFPSVLASTFQPGHDEAADDHFSTPCITPCSINISSSGISLGPFERKSVCGRQFVCRKASKVSAAYKSVRMARFGIEREQAHLVCVMFSTRS